MTPVQAPLQVSRAKRASRKEYSVTTHNLADMNSICSRRIPNYACVVKHSLVSGLRFRAGDLFRAEVFRGFPLGIVLATILLASTRPACGAVALVKDINYRINPLDSTPANIVDVNGVAFFVADDGVHGREIWTSDGTETGTVMVRDIIPWTGTAGPANLTSANGLLFFTANDGTNGIELWRSDGTSDGTTMVKNIASGTNSSSPAGLTAAGGLLFFAANDGTNGVELWKSDGTTSGTTMVKDIRPGGNSSNPDQLLNFGGVLFFTASDGVNGAELWRSDGTAGGTVMVKDIRGGSSSSNPAELTKMNGELFFRANDGTNGIELWRSDGSSNGTVMVKDISPGSGNSSPGGFTDVNGVLFFKTGLQLWKSDGTEAGTVMVAPLPFSYAYAANVNGVLYFIDALGDNLYSSDGTTNGTTLLFSADYDGCLRYDVHGYVHPFSFNGGNYFLSHCLPGLWQTDGTPAGSTLIKGIDPGNMPLVSPVNVNGTLFFAASDGIHGMELWKSDGTSNGTVLVKDIRSGTQSASPGQMEGWDATLYFQATDGSTGAELWKTDGTGGGTEMVADISPGANGSSPASLVAANSRLFFSASQSGYGVELWETGGSSNNTLMVSDINPGSASSSPYGLVNVNGTLFFGASTAVSGAELWKSDGSSNGTVMVKDIRPGGSGSSPAGLINLSGALFFTANDGTNGVELWTSDGSSNGTVMVRDILTGSGSASPANLVDVNGTLFFTANDAINGLELWKSDGSASGTVLVKDIRAGTNSSNPDHLVEVNGTLFFTATDGLTGVELWRSDGSSSGTSLVKDIYLGAASSSPSELCNVDGTLYFSATTTNGNELWKSDGTSNGTVQVKDIRPGPAGSSPSDLTKFASRLVFTADDGINGRELWTSDGTEAGTFLLADINPGVEASNPAELTSAGATLFFLASREAFGEELYALFREDFGDAPDVGGRYPTLLASDGARHLIPTGGATLYLGTNPPEGGIDAWPNSTATGDQEGGVALPAYLNSGQNQTATVVVTGGGGLLNAWVDWNADGDWSDPGEQILTNRPVSPGISNLQFTVPGLSVSGVSFARFRLSTASGLSPTGPAQDGEVEDYQVKLNLPPTVSGVVATHVSQSGAGHTNYFFSVEYSDDFAIDAGTVGAGDVVVTGPRGPMNVWQATKSPGTNASPLTATYTATPPGGSWDDADNGIYAVVMRTNRVADIGGLWVATNQVLATFIVNMDTTAPHSTINSHPPNLTNSAAAAFTFNADDGVGTGVATYEFSLDGSAFAPAASPQTVSGLSDGPHTFEVRATDAVGNVEANPASVTWTVDTTPPAVVIGPPSAPVATLGDSVSFAVTYSGADILTLAAADVILDASGTAAGTVSINGSGVNARTVIVTNLAGAGTLGVSIAAGSASDLAGNLAPAAGPSTLFQLIQPPPITLQIQELDNGTFLISFNGLSNRTYRLQYSDSLNPNPSPVWQTLGSVVVDDRGAGFFTNSPTADTRFYRAIFP